LARKGPLAITDTIAADIAEKAAAGSEKPSRESIKLSE
jgi:hypothetical protein